MEGLKENMRKSKTYRVDEGMSVSVVWRRIMCLGSQKKMSDFTQTKYETKGKLLKRIFRMSSIYSSLTHCLVVSSFHFRQKRLCRLMM